jgi:hypothetical protein
MAFSLYGLDFIAAADIPYYYDVYKGQINDVKKEEIVTALAIDYGYLPPDGIRDVVLDFLKDSTRYFASMKDFIPVDTTDLFSSDIRLNYDMDYKAIWMSNYCVDVLAKGERDNLFNIDTYNFDYTIEDGPGYFSYWYDQYSMDHNEIRFYNSVIWVGTYNFLGIKNIEKTDYGYKVVCTQKISESRNQLGIQVAWEYVKDKEYFDLLLYMDGDYLDMYIDNTSQKFGTLVRVEKEFITQFLSLIKTNTCNLTNVIWPRRADGSMDYPPPQLTQAAPEQPETIAIDTPPAGDGDAATVTPAGEAVVQQSGIGLPLIIVLIATGAAIAAGVVVFLIRRKRRP